MEEIYEYICKNLNNEISANKLMNKIERLILSLEMNPYKYPKVHIRKNTEIYHKLVVDNYIVLYDIEEKNKKVVIYRVIYGKRNYLNTIR